MKNDLEFCKSLDIGGKKCYNNGKATDKGDAKWDI